MARRQRVESHIYVYPNGRYLVRVAGVRPTWFPPTTTIKHMRGWIAEQQKDRDQDRRAFGELTPQAQARARGTLEGALGCASVPERLGRNRRGWRIRRRLWIERERDAQISDDLSGATVELYGESTRHPATSQLIVTVYASGPGAHGWIMKVPSSNFLWASK